jgi:hypothetical protein
LNRNEIVVFTMYKMSNYMSRNRECLCLSTPRSCMFFVNGADDDTTTLNELSQGDIAKLTPFTKNIQDRGVDKHKHSRFLDI